MTINYKLPRIDNIYLVLEFLLQFLGPQNDATRRRAVRVLGPQRDDATRRRLAAQDIGYCLGLLERDPKDALSLFHAMRAPNPVRLFRKHTMRGWERGMAHALAWDNLNQVARRQSIGASGGRAKAGRASFKTFTIVQFFDRMRAQAPDASARDIERQVAERLDTPVETVRSAIKRARRSKTCAARYGTRGQPKMTP